MKSNQATSWLLLAESYMYAAIVMSDECNRFLVELAQNRSHRLSIRLIPSLFVSIYNARHGIELFLKSLVIIQTKTTELPSKYRGKKIGHKIGDLYLILNEGNSELMPFSKVKNLLQGVDFHKDTEILRLLVDKYEKYSFNNLPSLINPELFSRVDSMNMFFRYPDKKPTNNAISKKVEDLFLIDFESYVESNFKELHNTQRLLEEIKKDMEMMFSITSKIGNNLAANIDRNA